MNQIAFEVREIHQSFGVFEHVVKYSAEMEIFDASRPFCVEILSVYPPDWSLPSVIEIGRQMIQRGAVRAFEGTGRAAHIRVQNFVIHPVDFSPKHVEEYTFRKIREIISDVR